MTSIQPIKYHCTPKSGDLISCFPRNLIAATRSLFYISTLLLLHRGAPFSLFFSLKVCVNNLQGKKRKKQTSRAEHRCFAFFLNDGNMYLHYLHEDPIAWKKSRQRGSKYGQCFVKF